MVADFIMNNLIATETLAPGQKAFLKKTSGCVEHSTLFNGVLALYIHFTIQFMSMGQFSLKGCHQNQKQINFSLTFRKLKIKINQLYDSLSL
jgi:hypothetical protein